MHVLVIADHRVGTDSEPAAAEPVGRQSAGRDRVGQAPSPADPYAAPAAVRFESERIAQAWVTTAPHVEITHFPFAAQAASVREVWQHHAASLGGFGHTALVDVDTTSDRWQEQLLADIHSAIAAQMTRIVVALPRYGFPDAGARFLEVLEAVQAAHSVTAHSVTARETAESEVNEASEENEISAVNGTAGDNITSGLLAYPQAFHQAVVLLEQLISQVDLIIAYIDNVPLTGMHGMAGTAALLGDLDQAAAQDQERHVARLVHELDKLEKTQPTLTSKKSLLATAPQQPGTDQPRSAGRYKELSRHDAAGVAGGIGFVLLAAGARAVPLNRALSAQFALPQHVAGTDLIVVKQNVVDGRTHAQSTLGVVTELALQHAVPVVVLTAEQIMSTRELAANGVATCYTVQDNELEKLSGRLAASWTPPPRADVT